MSKEFDEYLAERYRIIITFYGNQLLGLPEEKRVLKLLDMRNEDRYMAKLKKDPSGNSIMTEYNCPYSVLLPDSP